LFFLKNGNEYSFSSVNNRILSGNKDFSVDKSFTTNPQTDNAWKYSDFNGLEIGYKIKGYKFIGSTYNPFASIKEMYLILEYGYDLQINVNEQDADIKVDGETITNLLIENIAIGEHEIHVSKDHFYSETDNIVITDSSSLEIYNCDLQRSKYRVSVNVVPSSANVVINDIPAKTLWVPEGENVFISVSKDNYYYKNLTFTSEEDREINVELDRSEFLLIVNAIPPDSKVEINGEESNSKWLSKDEGVTVNVSRDHYDNEQLTFTMTEDKTVDVNLSKNEFLFEINAPDDATVEINGEKTNQMWVNGSVTVSVYRYLSFGYYNSFVANSDRTLDVELDGVHQQPLFFIYLIVIVALISSILFFVFKYADGSNLKKLNLKIKNYVKRGSPNKESRNSNKRRYNNKLNYNLHKLKYKFNKKIPLGFISSLIGLIIIGVLHQSISFKISFIDLPLIFYILEIIILGYLIFWSLKKSDRIRIDSNLRLFGLRILSGIMSLVGIYLLIFFFIFGYPLLLINSNQIGMVYTALGLGELYTIFTFGKDFGLTYTGLIIYLGILFGLTLIGGYLFFKFKRSTGDFIWFGKI